MDVQLISPQKPSSAVVTVGWVVTLLASALPDVIWQTVAGTPPLWLYWPKVGMLAILAALTWRLATLRPLRLFFTLLCVLEICWWLQSWVMSTPSWEMWESQIAWVPGMLVIQLFEIGAVFLVICILLLFRRRLKEAYLAIGNLRAAVAPVRWLGQRRPTTWPEFGPVLAAALFLGGLVFLWLMNPPAGEVLKMMLPLLPGVVLIAAVNAFDEEVIYRCGLMYSLEGSAGKQAALWLSAVFFGLAHFSGGFPGGLPWFVLTGFIGYMIGKSVQESRGLVWAIGIHLIADLPVLAFSAMATLASRGF